MTSVVSVKRVMSGRSGRSETSGVSVVSMHSWAQYSIVGLVYHVSGGQCVVLCAGGVNSVWGVQGMRGGCTVTWGSASSCEYCIMCVAGGVQCMMGAV